MVLVVLKKRKRRFDLLYGGFWCAGAQDQDQRTLTQIQQCKPVHKYTITQPAVCDYDFVH